MVCAVQMDSRRTKEKMGEDSSRASRVHTNECNKSRISRKECGCDVREWGVVTESRGRHDCSAELRSWWLSCRLTDGMVCCVGMYKLCRWCMCRCASSSLMGEFGREWSTHVDVGTSVFVVDWVISDASDSSWCTPFVICWLCG